MNRGRPEQAPVRASRVSLRWLAGTLLLGGFWAGAVAAEGFFDGPGGRGLASLVVPGSGQLLHGNPGDGWLQLSLAVGSAGVAAHYHSKGVLSEDQRYDDAREIQFYDRDTLRADIFTLLYVDTAFYSSYAAYRDGRLAEAENRYRTPPPTERFADLVAAPFRLEYLKRPTTFVPLLLAAVSLSQARSGDPDDGLYEIRYADDVDRTELYLFQTAGIGIGPAVAEEAFFRGFLNNQFSHKYGPGLGLAFSSLVFGAGHAGSGNQANFGAASLAGAYLGWVQQRNDYAIGEGVAIHFWSNFLVGLAAVSNGGAASNLLSFSLRF